MPKATRIGTFRQNMMSHDAIYELDPPHRFRNNRRATHFRVISSTHNSYVYTVKSPLSAEHSHRYPWRVKLLTIVRHVPGNVSHDVLLRELGYDEIGA